MYTVDSFDSTKVRWSLYTFNNSSEGRLYTEILIEIKEEDIKFV